MPYAVNSDLPAPVRHHLPPGAQTIYREAFNGAWQQYAKSSHRVAWAAVKKRYRKAGDIWVPLDVAAASPRPRRRRA